MQLDLVSPGTHRINAAEVAIRDFKTHFLSVLAVTAQDFLPSLCDRLLPQAEITIDMLRQSNTTPNVSTYAHLSRPSSYNKMPLAPMCISVQVHEKTDKRGIWSYHTVNGWYLATSPEHYLTHRCHIKSTKNERFIDTIHFNHKNLTQPNITHYEKVVTAIADCAKAIKYLGSSNRSEEMSQLIQIKERALQHRTYITTTPKTTTYAPASSRVPLYINNNTRQRILMTQSNLQVPKLSTPSVPRVEQF